MAAKTEAQRKFVEMMKAKKAGKAKDGEEKEDNTKKTKKTKKVDESAISNLISAVFNKNYAEANKQLQAAVDEKMKQRVQKLSGK